MKKIFLVLSLFIFSTSYIHSNSAAAFNLTAIAGSLLGGGGSTAGELGVNTPSEDLIADPGCSPEIRKAQEIMANAELDRQDNMSKNIVNLGSAPPTNAGTCMSELAKEIASMGAIFSGQGPLSVIMNDTVTRRIIAPMIEGVLTNYIAPIFEDVMGSFGALGNVILDIFGFTSPSAGGGSRFDSCAVMRKFWEAIQCTDFNMPTINVGIPNWNPDLGCVGDALLGDFVDNINILKDRIIIGVFNVVTVQSTIDQSMNVIRKQYW